MKKEPVEILTADKVEQDIIKFKWKLIKAITDHATSNNLTQVELAKEIGVSQPRVSKIVNGQVSELRIDYLMRVTGKLGLQVIDTNLI